MIGRTYLERGRTVRGQHRWDAWKTCCVNCGSINGSFASMQPCRGYVPDPVRPFRGLRKTEETET